MKGQQGKKISGCGADEAAELDARLASGEPLQVVDVRSASDFTTTHVPGAVNIPLAELRDRLGELDPDVPTVTYCNKGVSGNAGQNILLRHGLRNCQILWIG